MSKETNFRLSWDQYGVLVNDLWVDLKSKLDSTNTKIDAIIMIVREGGFTALPLAYKLNTYKVLSIQYKYILKDGGNELKFISGLPDTTYEIPETPVFLLCDTFPAGGQTKNLAINKIKEKYPKAKFVFASLIQDSLSDQIPEIIFSAFAVDVDKGWKTNHPIYKEAGVENVLYTLLPWENEEEELAGVEQKEWRYN